MSVRWIPAMARTPPPVKRLQCGQDQCAHGSEEDGGVEPFGRRFVGATGAGGSELEGQLTGLRCPSHHMDPSSFSHRDLCGEMS